MNVVHVNTFDTQGGAAIACKRLNESLKKTGVNSNLLVQTKKSKDSNIYSAQDNFINKKSAFLRLLIEKLLFFPYEKDKDARFAFSTAKTGIDITFHPIIKQADIINLHWINFGFLSLKSIHKLLNLKKPIVWTLHDMWPFTGGCHHALDCENYKLNCGNCPFLKSPNNTDISYKIYAIKNNIYSEKDLHIVSVSNWLKEKAEESSLFKNLKHYVIPNTINTNFFKEVQKSTSKSKLGLDPNKKYILFGAPKIDDPVKGFDLFVKALKMLSSKNHNLGNDFEVLLFGKIKDNKENFLKQIPFKTKYLGYINPELLPSVYSSAELTVVSSKYETFGQIISESMSCKTPVVAFNNGGPKDIIDHKANGYLADYLSEKDLAEGINWLINAQNINEIGDNARQKIESHFTEEIIANQYYNLYNEILINDK